MGSFKAAIRHFTDGRAGTGTLRAALAGGVLAGLLLAGCAAPGAPGSAGSAPGAATAARPSASDAINSQKADQIRQDLDSRGWSFVGMGGVATDPNMHFVRGQALSRTDAKVRIWVMLIGASDLPARASGAQALASLKEFDCGAKTHATIQMTSFRDRFAKDVIMSFRTNANVDEVKTGTVLEQLMRRACNTQVASQAGSGSGVIVGQERVLTNLHVVANCQRLEVVAGGNFMNATVVERDAANDLVLLNVAGLRGQPIGIRSRAVTGESVLVTGYPLAGLLATDMIVTNGVVSALAGLGNHPGHLQISAPVQPGNSGGALVDKSGNLVGVVVSKLNAARALQVTGDLPQNINFAIKPELVRLFLEANGVVFRDVPPGPRLESEVITEQARAFTVKVECNRASRPIAAASGAALN